jgi:hypothetical protein
MFIYHCFTPKPTWLTFYNTIRKCSKMRHNFAKSRKQTLIQDGMKRNSLISISLPMPQGMLASRFLYKTKGMSYGEIISVSLSLCDQVTAFKSLDRLSYISTWGTFTEIYPSVIFSATLFHNTAWFIQHHKWILPSLPKTISQMLSFDMMWLH